MKAVSEFYRDEKYTSRRKRGWDAAEWVLDD